MRIGIIGSGAVGSKIGQLWAQAGHKVLFSSRHPEQLSALVTHVGSNASAGTVSEASQFGEVVLLAINYWTLEEGLQQVDDKFSDKIVVDATNPLKWTSRGTTERLLPQEVIAGLVMAQRLPTARIVKAFNTVYAGSLETYAHRKGNPVAIPIAGDDEVAKKTVAQLVEDAGYFPVDIGTLDKSKPLDPGGFLWHSGITEVEIRQRLELSQ